MRQLKISRHYVFSSSFSSSFKQNWVCLDKTAENFLSLNWFFFFFFFFFFSLSIYYARDSCKKWQENIDKLGLISRLKNFSSLFFFFFFGVTESNRLRQLKISRHYFVFVLFSFFGVIGSVRLRLLKISRHYFFSSFFLLFFFSSLDLSTTGGDSCKKVTRKYRQDGCDKTRATILRVKRKYRQVSIPIN